MPTRFFASLKNDNVGNAAKDLGGTNGYNQTPSSAVANGLTKTKRTVGDACPYNQIGQPHGYGETNDTIMPVGVGAFDDPPW